VDIEANTVIRLFDEVDNIFGIKEATGSIERSVELLSKRPELYLFSGDDAIDYPNFGKWWKGDYISYSNLLPDLRVNLSTQH